MRQHARRLRLTAGLLGLSFVVAACGDDNTEAGDKEERTETTGAHAGGVTAPPVGEANPTCEGESDGIVRFGGLLPETGNLAFLGPPVLAGAQLAIQDINAAGGVLARPVEYIPGDSGDTSTDVASQTVQRHLNAGVDVVIGAASSGVTSTVIDTITGACRIQFSPANTSPDFTDYQDDDLYFRTAPSNVLQGLVLADLAIEDGVETLALLAVRDPYGEGLLRFTKERFEEGGGEVVVDRVYDPRAPNFDAEVDDVVSADPNGLVLIGSDESSRVLTSLFQQGFTADAKKIYLVDQNIGNPLGQGFTDPGALVGIRGTLPSAEVSKDFRNRLLEVDADLIDFSHGPEAYDAVVISALASKLAGTDNPAEVARHINGVTRDGEVCTGFAECAELIDGGETDVLYEGPSGPLRFSQPGEPTEAMMLIQAYGEDNRIDPSRNEYRTASF